MISVLAGIRILLVLLLPAYLYTLLTFEEYFHVHPVVFVILIVTGIFLIYPQWKLSRTVRIFLVLLWFVILLFEGADFVRTTVLWDFTEPRFQEKVDQSTAQLSERVRELWEHSLSDSIHLQEEVRAFQGETYENLFIGIQKKIGNSSYNWAVYDPSGTLLAWKGDVPRSETFLPEGEVDVSVWSAAHRQFLRYKTSFREGNFHLFLVVLNPIAADYRIENRYLHNYNILTDPLPMRPDLLYNSSRSTTASPELVIRHLQVSPDFTVSAVYKRQQYGEFLIHRSKQLHGWVELTALIYLLFLGGWAFFDFVGLAGSEKNSKKVWLSWVNFVGISILSLFVINGVHNFAEQTLFHVEGSSDAMAARLFHSPGGLACGSLIALTLACSLVLLVRRSRAGVAWESQLRNHVLLFGMLLASGFALTAYFSFVRTTLLGGPFDPIDRPLFRVGFLKLSEVFGMLWLDLAVVICVAVFYSVVLRRMPRSRGAFWRFFLLQSIAFVICYRFYQLTESVPFVPFLILYTGIGLLVFFMPALWASFERWNLLSRFLLLLVLFSVISFLFHFTRYHYVGYLQHSFVEEEAATLVKDRDQWMEKLMESSCSEVDRALWDLSLDPRIPDLAYRIWAGTDFARFGYRSALAVHGLHGEVLNRFSLGVPRLSIPFGGMETWEGWLFQTRTVNFVNETSPIRVAIRELPSGGYVSIVAVEDYQNLPFVPAGNPFQELFRPGMDSRLHGGSLYLNLYDDQWRPVFITQADQNITTQKGRELLAESSEGWVRESSSARSFDVYYFRIPEGFAALLIPGIPLRSHLVHLMDLLFSNLLWFSLFSLTTLLFFRRYLNLHFPIRTSVRFNFFQKLLLAFIALSMIPMLSFSFLIREYVWGKKVEEVTSRALNSFSVATRVVGDYLLLRTEGLGAEARETVFTNELLEWIGQVIGQDLASYYEQSLFAASYRELFSAGLMGQQIPSKTFVDLFLKSQKYSITEMEVGSFRFLQVSGRLPSGRYKDVVIAVPFLIDERSVDAEITALREYMMMVGVGLVFLAVSLGYFLAGRFTRPVRVLTHGTGEMSRGNLRFRIRQSYQDEFQQLVESFNRMADSISEQQGALERRRAYIENILNHITTAVISIDNAMNVATYNPAAMKMFGGHTFPKDLDHLLPDSNEWAPVQKGIQEFLQDRGRFQFHEYSIMEDAQERSVRFIYVPLMDQGQWNGALLLAEDITDIIRSNRLSAWAEMARRVAHEVKNPLTPIQLAVEHLVRVYEDRSENFGEVLQNCSQTVLKQVKTLRGLVSEFSHYGRPATLNRSAVDLERFVEDLVSQYRRHLPDSITMEVHGESLPEIQMDADKIRSVLINIIENSLQALNGTGRIDVDLHRGQNGFVEIEVRDDGKGIPPDQVSRLFEPYFSTKSGGTGLGLAIARKHVEEHGGKIHVESSLDHGTRVTLSLPIS